jgi:hypothetical protein
MPEPAVLRIVQYDGTPGYYLLNVDDAGRELSDTWHETLDGAMRQATWEFQVRPEEWAATEN